MKKPLREIAAASRKQYAQPQLRDYTVAGKKSIKQERFVYIQGIASS